MSGKNKPLTKEERRERAKIRKEREEAEINEELNEMVGDLNKDGADIDFDQIDREREEQAREEEEIINYDRNEDDRELEDEINKEEPLTEEDKELAEIEKNLPEDPGDDDEEPEIEEDVPRKSQEEIKAEALERVKNRIRVVITNLGRLTIQNGLKADKRMQPTFSKLSNAGYNEMMKLYGQNNTEGISANKIRGAIACSMISQRIAIEKKKDGNSATELEFIKNPSKVFLSYANSDAVKDKAQKLMDNPRKEVENYVLHNQKELVGLNIGLIKENRVKREAAKVNQPVEKAPEKKIEDEYVIIDNPPKQPEVKAPEVKEPVVEEPEVTEPEFVIENGTGINPEEIVEDYIPVEKAPEKKIEDEYVIIDNPPKQPEVKAPEVKEPVVEEPEVTEPEFVIENGTGINPEEIVEDYIPVEKAPEKKIEDEYVIIDNIPEEPEVNEPEVQAPEVNEPEIREETRPVFDENKMKGDIIDKIGTLGPEIVAGSIQGMSLIGGMANKSVVTDYEGLCAGLSAMMVAKLAQRDGLEMKDILAGSDPLDKARALGLTNTVREMASKLHNDPEACADFMANHDKYLDEMGDEYIGLNRDDLKKKLDKAAQKNSEPDINQNEIFDDEPEIEKFELAKGITNLMVDDMVRQDSTGKLGQLMEGPKGERMFRACMMSKPIMDLTEKLFANPENLYDFFMKAQSGVQELGQDFRQYLGNRNSKDIKLLGEEKKIEKPVEEKQIEVQENVL